MSVFSDTVKMQERFGATQWAAARATDPATLRDYLGFRQQLLEEECAETGAAVEAGDTAEIVDGLIDVIVIAAGTLGIFGVDGEKAWAEVMRANMAKEPGVKPGRPNPHGMPDMLKPEGWVEPNHEGNTGFLPEAGQ